jgi:hypothetical protein
MEDNWLWYLSGSMDTAISMTVNIRKNAKRSLDYVMMPRIMYSRPKAVDSVFGMIDEYATDVGANYRFEEMQTSNRIIIENAGHCRRFLEPIVGGFVQQKERAEFFLEEVLPNFEDGHPETEEEFMEVVELMEELEDMPIGGRKRKYDVNYFREEWG